LDRGKTGADDGKIVSITPLMGKLIRVKCFLSTYEGTLMAAADDYMWREEGSVRGGMNG